jgi:hypothetical protein
MEGSSNTLSASGSNRGSWRESGDSVTVKGCFL